MLHERPICGERRKNKHRKRDKWILRTTEHGTKQNIDIILCHLKSTLEERMRDYTKTLIKITPEQRESRVCPFCRFQGILQRVHTNHLPQRDIIEKVLNEYSEQHSYSDVWQDTVENLFSKCKNIQDTHGYIVVACHKCNPYLEEVERDKVGFFKQYPHSWKDYIEYIDKLKSQPQESTQRSIYDFFETPQADTTSEDTEEQTDSGEELESPILRAPDYPPPVLRAPDYPPPVLRAPDYPPPELPSQPSALPSHPQAISKTRKSPFSIADDISILNIAISNELYSPRPNIQVQSIVPEHVEYCGPLGTKWTYGTLPDIDWRASLMCHDIFQRAGFVHGEHTSLGKITQIYDWLVSQKQEILLTLNICVFPHVRENTLASIKQVIKDLSNDADIRKRRKDVALLIKQLVECVCKGSINRKRKQVKYFVENLQQIRNFSHRMSKLIF